MKIMLFVACLAATTMLLSCNTFSGIGKDIQEAAEWVSNKSQQE
ncbi:MAG: hypothetical protein VX354_01840 [Pseudomonadota bacterium]